MTSESARPELVGLTVSDAAPILHQHVRLRPGLTAVFGKNGVGKTRLLRAIGDMLRLANTSTTQVFMDLAGNEAEVPLTRSQAPTLDQVMYGYSAFHFQAGGTDDAGDWTPFEGESSDIWTHEAQVRYIADSLPPSVGEEAAEYLLAQGRQWHPAGTGLLCLADPDPYGGPLNRYWEKAQESWRSILVERRYSSNSGYPTSPSLTWNDEHSCWDVSYRRYPRSRDLGSSSVPFLPPLPETLGLGTWPDWVGAPFTILGRSETTRFQIVSESSVDINQETARSLPFNFDWTPARRGGPSEPTRDAAAAIQAETNRLLSSLFDEPPLTTLTVRRPEDWFRGRSAVTWTASSDIGRPQVRLEHLGSAHQRFINFAIQRSLQARSIRAQDRRLQEMAPEPPVAIIVVDEPERALHPAAERSVAEGLRTFADYTIVATHSTEMIDMADYSLHARSSGSTMTLEPLWLDLDPSARRRTASALGLTPSRLAALTKVLVLVEGPHDAAIIGEWLSEDLRRSRAEVIPLGGTYGLKHIAEARYLLSANDAPMVICLDNAGAISEQDLEALRRCTAASGQRELNRTRRAWSKTPEGRQLHELITAAHKNGQLDRIHTFGFERHDIAEYLPVRKIAPQFASWSEAFQAFFDNTERTAAAKGDGVEFKKWINSNNGRYHTEGIQLAAREMVAEWSESGTVAGGRPPEFSNLAELIDQLATSHAVP